MIKYSGIAGVLVAVLVVVGTVHGIHRQRADVLNRTSAADATAALLVRAAVSGSQRRQLARASATLQRVQRLPAGTSLTADIIAVPPNSLAGSNQQRPEVVRASVAHTHVVSMVFIGEGQRYAVVDGRFCMQGTRLSPGDRVRRIVPGKVLVSMDGVNRWFYVGGMDVAEQASVHSPQPLVHGA